MLCPEVWKFNSNAKKSSYQLGNYDTNAKKMLKKTMENNNFTQMVSIILPECDTVPESIQEIINSNDYYLVRNLGVGELLEKDFVEAFVRRGTLTAISLKTDQFENKVYITPDGKLSLLVGKDLYQILGLEGRAVGKSKEQFEITIDLKDKQILDQPKLYNRIKNALSNIEIEEFDLQLTWKSIDSTVCPSSIAKFFQDNGHKVEQHSLQMLLRPINNLAIPNEAISKAHIDTLTAHQIAEYFAFVMLECDVDSAAEELNSYCPSLNLSFEGQSQRRGKVLHLKGLMSSEFVGNLLEELRKVSSGHEQTVIVSVNGEEFPANGKAGQMFVLLNNQKYFLFKV